MSIPEDNKLLSFGWDAPESYREYKTKAQAVKDAKRVVIALRRAKVEVELQTQTERKDDE